MANLTVPETVAPRRGAAVHRFTLWQRIRRTYWGYLFILPWVVLYAVFGIYPFVLSFYLTFFDYSFVAPQNRAFVGLGNWVQGLLDPLFWRSLFNIVYNQAIFILLKNGLGLLTAVLVFRARHGGSFFRTVFFMPVLTSTIVLTTIFGYLVSPTGPVQSLLVNVGLLSEPIFWTFTTWLPMPILAVMNTWKWFGISFVILLAGLHSIDPQQYEAAAIDGAGSWQQFFYVSLPQLSGQLFFLLVVDVINGLQMFTEVFAIFGVSGGANRQALTPVLFIYENAFSRSNIGYASALGLLLAIFIAILTFVQFRFGQKE
ncbi:MAG: sugar ABC transporter permease [Caldilineaceae bacterium]|nr:sugar ABC transporter permease [Caldilineaceae bacterium]